MEKLKRLCAVLLALTMVLTLIGCGGTTSSDKNNSNQSSSDKKSDSSADHSRKNGKEGAKGRYIETELAAGAFSKVSSLTKLENGSYRIYNKENGTVATSTDKGISWEIEDVAKLTEIYDNGAEILGVLFFKDGSIFVSYIDWNEVKTTSTHFNNRYVRISADHTVTEGMVQFEDEQSRVASVIAAPDGSVVVQDMDSMVYSLELESGAITKIMQPLNNQPVMLYTTQNYVILQGQADLAIYDRVNHEEIETDRVLADFITELETTFGNVDSLGIVQSAEEEAIYVACNKGVYRHVMNGNVMEQLIDGSLTSLSSPNKSIVGIIAEDEGSFVIAYSDGTICSYIYDENVAAVPENEITIYSLYQNTTVLQAISLYQNAHQDTHVKYEVGISGEDGVTVSDAIKTLNTELLGGEGPDVLILDNMPIDSYIEKGMLLDMSSLLEDLKSDHAYFEPILGSYATEKNIYAAPLRFGIPVLCGETGTVAEIKDLKSLADTVEKKRKEESTGSILGIYTGKEVLSLLLATSSPAFYNQKGNMDKEAITEFLTQSGRIYEQEQMGITDALRERHEEVQAAMLKYNGTRDPSRIIEDVQLNLGGNAFEILGAERPLFAGFLSGYNRDADRLVATKKQLGTIDYVPWNGLSQNTFVPSGIVGISSATKQEDLAKDFVSTLFSKEVQQVVQTDGYPVNKTAFQEAIISKEEPFSEGVSRIDGTGGMLSLETVAIDDKNAAKIEKMADALTTPSLIDSVIVNTILELGAPAVEGKSDIAEAVDSIMQKLSIYTQE